MTRGASGRTRAACATISWRLAQLLAQVRVADRPTSAPAAISRQRSRYSAQPSSSAVGRSRSTRPSTTCCHAIATSIRVVRRPAAPPCRSGRPATCSADHHRVAVVLIRAVVDLVGQRLHQALHERRQRQRVVEVARHVAHAHFDGAEVVVRPHVPPDLADRVDEAGVDHVVHQPHVLAPVAHQRRQAGGGQAFHHLRAVRLQARSAAFPERAAAR